MDPGLYVVCALIISLVVTRVLEVRWAARSPVAQVMQNDWSKGARIEEADRVKAASSSRGSAAAWSPAAQAPPGPRFLVESTHSAARRLAQRLGDVEASPQRPLRCCAT
jgi:hypothetical protein